MMAAPLAVCRLRTLRCLQRLDVPFQRSIGTHVGAAQAEVTRRDDGDEKEKDGPKSFYDVQAERREQAEKSVLISCPPITNENKFLNYLSKYGDVKKHFFYESNGTYAVVEFASLESVTSLLAGAAMPSVRHDSTVPLKSRLLSLRNLGSVDSLKQQIRQQHQPQTAPPIKELIQRLSLKENIDSQIIHLTETHQLTEENTRLRFLVCSLLEDIACAYFPECTIKLFGSSVNGFGKLGCDLDMFLDLDSISGRNMETPKSDLSLEYQMKRASSARDMTQSILSVIGDSVDQFGPGCVGMQKILKARCPLVRFSHQPSGFQCDLTANNRVAVKSSELLHLYGLVDSRVRGLVFTLRCWAQAQNITSSIPGARITNFSLTVMALFFLQRRSPPIIPTLDHLRDLAGPADECLIDGHDCTFVSNTGKIPIHRNTATLEQLLCEFFEFYASFPFGSVSISIRKGKEINKPEVAPLHIQNPFETSLNISKNVNAVQLDRFVILCQESSWLLQKRDINTPRKQKGNNNCPAPWGLACLLKPQSTGLKGDKKRGREVINERIMGLLESLKNKRQ